MVESSKEKFTGLNLKEISSKISSFTNSEKTIRVWSKESEPSLAFIRFYEGCKIHLDISTSMTEFEIDTKVFINFAFNSVDYFAKGIVLNNSEGLVILDLEDDVFKSEKRQNEIIEILSS